MPIDNNLAQQSRRATRVLTEENCLAPLGVIGLDLMATATTAAARTAIGSVPTAGVVAGTGVTLTEALAGTQTVFTLTNVSIAITDTGGANGGQGSLKIYDFPEGQLYILGAVANLTIARVGTGLAATAAVVGSIGSAAAGVGNATLTSTEADMIPSTTCTLTAGAGTFVGIGTAPALFDGTATAVDAILNFAVPDAGISATDALTVNGTITVTWFYLGDK